MCRIAFLLAVALEAVSSTAQSAETPTAEKLLSAYQKSVEQLSRVRFQCVSKHPEQLADENNSLASTQERTVARDGNRWKVSNNSTFRITENGVVREGGDQREYLVGGQFLEVVKNREGAVFVSAWLDPTTARDVTMGRSIEFIDPARLHWAVLSGVEILFGRCEGDVHRPLWDVMRETSTLELLPGTEDIDGAKTYVLKSRGKYGEHMLWIDAACGGLPRRIEIRKDLGDFYGENQLGARLGAADEAPPTPASARQVRRRQPLDFRAVRLCINGIKLENKNGVYVMTEWKSEVKSTIGDRKPRELREEHAVGTIEFDPETWPNDALRLTIDVPDKTNVFVRDGLAGMSYEWIGGEIKVRTGK